MQFLIILPLISCLLACMTQTCVNTCNRVSLLWKWSSDGRVEVYGSRRLTTFIRPNDGAEETGRQALHHKSLFVCHILWVLSHFRYILYRPSVHMMFRLWLKVPGKDIWQNCQGGSDVIILFLWCPALGKLIIMFFIFSFKRDTCQEAVENRLVRVVYKSKPKGKTEITDE